MADSRAPLYLNSSTGNVDVFGGEDALTWNFTSAAGNPVTINVGGSPYFTMDRTGEFQLEAGITWNADSGGDVGEQYDHRPDNVHVATQAAVGAASGVGDGSRLSLNSLIIGHGNVNKTLGADQGLGPIPNIRYNAAGAKWQFSDDGIAYVDMSALVAPTWDNIYALDKTLDIDSTVLTFDQSATTGVGFTVSRNLASGFTDAAIMVVSNQNASDDQVALSVTSAGGPTASVTFTGDPAASLNVLTATAAASGALGAAADLRAVTAAITPNAGDNASAVYQGFYATGSAVGASTKYGFRADANWDYGFHAAGTSYFAGVELQTGDVLIGPVGLTDKDVTAYQTGVNDPKIRYQNAGTKWQFTNDGTTWYDVLIPTWDALYALDQTLTIAGSPLTFSQTAVTGSGFVINRNLASGSTDAPIVKINNQNASDDQYGLQVLTAGGPGVVVALTGTPAATQRVAAASATASGGLGAASDIRVCEAAITDNAADNASAVYQGFYATGSAAGSATRYGFRADANWSYGFHSAGTSYFSGVELQTRDVLIGPVGLTDKDITAYQSGVNDPKIRYQNAGTKWQFTNDGTTWYDIPITWDTLYANDKTLTVDAAALTLTQTAVTSNALVVARNLASGSTDAPIVKIDNQNAGDDQAGLQVLSAGGLGLVVALTGAPAAVQPVAAASATASSGLGAASDIRVYAATIADNAADNASAVYQGFYATGAAAGSAEKYGFRADANWDYGFHSAGTSYFSGVELQTGDVLIGPVGLTNKDITAYQSGVNDPKVRYQNAGTKWEFTNDGTTWYDFLTSIAWDAIYAGDKTLDIDTSALTFDQSSTSGYGFVVSRNLASGSTDSPVMRVYNQNAGDDQHALEVNSAGICGLLATCTGTVLAGNKAHEIKFEPAGPLGAGTIYNTYVTTTTNGNANHIGMYFLKGGAGAGVNTAIDVSTGWYYSIRTASPIYAQYLASVVTDRNVINSLFTSSGSAPGSPFTGSCYTATWSGNAGDTANCIAVGFKAVGTTTGSSTRRGFEADTNWDRGLYSIPPCEITTETDVAEVALILDQNDEDQGFINFAGSTPGAAYDSAKNLTTWQGGAGAVVGPLGQAVAEAYWAWGGMMRHEVNGSEVWVPYYTYAT